MQFVSFIASTILIVMISQHSTMGLPVNDTVVEKSCLDGFKLIKGQCVPLDYKSNVNGVESSSFSPERITINEKKPVLKEDEPRKFGSCPEGMKHGEHGICQTIKDFDTTEMPVESTTNDDENSGPEVNLHKCPEGTEHDEQGACQETKPSVSEKTPIDLKTLLKKDGSCLDNYKMIDGRCLYIKPKINSTLYPGDLTNGDHLSSGIRPKSGNDETIKSEVVPVLFDNSCPEGTEYSENGLCQKRLRPVDSKVPMKIDTHCPTDSESINGKCVYKSKLDKFESAPIMKPLATTLQPIINDDLSKPTPVMKSSRMYAFE